MKEKHTNQEPYNWKPLLIISGVIIAILIIVLISFKFKTTEPLTVYDLHKQNLKGELDEDKGYLYNGFSFVKIDGMWYTQINKNETNTMSIPTRYGPKDLENIPIKGKLNPEFNQANPLYISFNPLDDDKYHTFSMIELAQIIAAVANVKPEASCLVNETDQCAERKIITCETEKPAIVIQREPGPKIELEKNCIKIIGEGEDMIKATERLIFQWIGIMN